MSDPCPNCRADASEDWKPSLRQFFRCGSYLFGGKLGYESELCNTRKERDDLKDKLSQLQGDVDVLILLDAEACHGAAEMIRKNKELITERDQLSIVSEKQETALTLIANCIDSPAIDPTGDIQFGLHCGVEDRQLSDRYEGADYGYSQGVERALEWAVNEARAALAELDALKGESR